MLKQIEKVKAEYKDLQRRLADPKIATNPKKLKIIGKRISELEPGMSLIREYEECQRNIDEVEDIKNDPELLAIAKEEAVKAGKRQNEIKAQLLDFFAPKNPHDSRCVILEVRAGTGGEEAALFAAELLRMYIKYAESQGWIPELFNKNDTESGGIKEAIVKISGRGVYGKLKFESGVHRVQRVPATESQGRLHTSAASVVIMPEAEEVDIKIKPEDLKINVFRSSGPGGQSVNTTDSAVRITHIPTNTVVVCQDEKSQLKNKNKAMSILRSRLYADQQEQLAKERGEIRAVQIGSGDRSEKIRTYNYPQDRVTDHRIRKNFSNLPEILNGNLECIIKALQTSFTNKKIRRSTQGSAD